VRCPPGNSKFLLFDGLYQACFPATVRNRYSQNFREIHIKILPAVIACSCVWFAFPATAGEQSLKTRFVPKGELTTNEVNLVIQLADKSGIKELEEVSTDYIHPSTNLCIGAKEKETRDARNVTFRCLFIGKRGWVSKGPSNNKAIQIGDLWVQHVTREDLTILNVKQREYRVHLRDGIQPELAERILEAFQSAKFRVERKSDEKLMPLIDFAQPSALWVRADGTGMRMSFTSKHDRLEWFSIHFTFDDGEITILQIMDIIA